jgi:membrane carboxypeptidase/penicillin-binding protein PbpC
VHTWTVGGSSRVATAVWVGNAKGQVALRATSINGLQAALLRHPIFHNVMRAVDRAYPAARSFPAVAPQFLSGTGKALPNVVGMSVNAATSILTADGFKVTV